MCVGRGMSIMVSNHCVPSLPPPYSCDTPWVILTSPSPHTVKVGSGAHKFKSEPGASMGDPWVPRGKVGASFCLQAFLDQAVCGLQCSCHSAQWRPQRPLEELWVLDTETTKAERASARVGGRFDVPYKRSCLQWPVWCQPL